MEQINSVIFDVHRITVHRKTKFNSDGDPYYETVFIICGEEGTDILSVYSDEYIRIKETGDTQ